MSKKRSNSFHKPAIGTHHSKKSQINVTKKRPFVIDSNQENIGRQKSIPKAHKESNTKKTTKNNQTSPPKKKNISPKKQSSGKKSRKSRQYDSPSKQHDDLDYFIIRSHKQNKKDKKANAQIEALEANIKEKLKRNKIPEAIAILSEAKNKDPNNYYVNYLLGVCYLVNGQYNHGITLFKSLLTAPKPKKDVYLMLSVCFKKLEEYSNTEAILDACIQKFPKYYEAYVYRGRLYIKMKKFEQASHDFQQAIFLHPDKQIGYTGKGDCFRSAELYEQAIQLYNTALNIQYNSSVLLRRAICYLQIEKWDRALADIQRLLEDDAQSSQVLYFKGLIYTKKKNYNEAIICYQQAIKYDTHKKAVARSIYEIAKIKIQQRDYYEAFYTLSRVQYLDIDIKSLQKFRTFTDGVTSLMKKNYSKGIDTLNQLYKQHNLTKFLKPLFYSCRAYGLMCIEKFQQARSDFLRLQKQTALDNANLFNKFICEGILSCKMQKYEQSLSYFSKAEKVLPKRLEPNFYKAATLIRFSNRLIPKNLVDKKKQYLASALKTVLKVENITQNNSGLFLIRGLLYLCLEDKKQALNDLTRSIEDSIVQKAIHFYLKGLALAELYHFQQAIHQFNTAIHHDQLLHQYPQLYLNRAKCHLLLGQANQAFNDLQQYMSYRSTSPDIHIWAGHALFHVGSYQDAAKTYSNINNIKRNPKVLQFRAACYLTMKNLAAAQEDLKCIVDIQDNKSTYFDYKMIQIFTQCRQQNQIQYSEIITSMKNIKNQTKKFGNIFTKSDYCFYKAILYIYVPNYDKAIKNFQKALDIVQQKLDLQDFENQQHHGLNYDKKTFTKAECLYNMAVCQSLNGHIPKAIKTLELVKKQLEENNQKEKRIQAVQNFIAVLQNQKKMLFAAPPQRKTEIEVIQIFPFPFENRLCSIFQEITIPLSRDRIKTRLFFCLPQIKKPDIVPHIDEKTMQTVDLNWIQIRPQAPWIKRNEQGVIFTDQVVTYQVQISQSQQSQDQKQGSEQQRNKYQQEDYDYQVDQHQQAMYMNEHSDGSTQRQQVAPPNPRDFARMMRLDQDTEARLARLLQN